MIDFAVKLNKLAVLGSLLVFHGAAPVFTNAWLLLDCEDIVWADTKHAWPQRAPGLWGSCCKSTRLTKMCLHFPLQLLHWCILLSSNRICSSPFQWCMSREAWELEIHKQNLNSHRKSSSSQSSIPSGSSLPRGQLSRVNSSLHPDD